MDQFLRSLFPKETSLEQRTGGSEEIDTGRNTAGNLVREIIRRHEERLATTANNKEEEKITLFQKLNTVQQVRPCIELKTTEHPGAKQKVQKIQEEECPKTPEKPLLQGKTSRDASKVPGSTLALGDLRLDGSFKSINGVEEQVKLLGESSLKTQCYQGTEPQRGNGNLPLRALKQEVQSQPATHQLVKETFKLTVKLPKDLITFMKSSGYQLEVENVKYPVLFDSGSDWVLSGESYFAIHEALAAVEEDLSVETVKLRGAEAVPPELDRVMETLINAQNEANRDGLRARVRFFPGLEGNTVTKVRMVGFSNTVNKLNKILQVHLWNWTPIQEALTLPHPRLVACFDKFMDVIGMAQTQVTFKASHHMGPRVVLSGPRCKVQEAKQSLTSALDDVTSDTLVLDGLGAQRYFQADGKVSKELIESSCNVVIMAQKGMQHLNITSAASNTSQITSTGWQRQTHTGLQPTTQCDSDTYQCFERFKGQNQGNRASTSSFTPDLEAVSIVLKDGVMLQLVFGNITDEKTDVVVNSTNFRDFQGGVCNAILSVAGRHLEALLKTAKVNQGAVFRTPPGLFPCKSIFHVDGRRKTSVIEQLVNNIIQECESLQYKSVAIPAICAGAAQLDHQAVAHTILQTIKTATSSAPLLHLSNIRLVLIDRTLFSIFKQQLLQIFPQDVTSKGSCLQVGDVQRLLSTGSTGEQSTFFFLGFCRRDVDNAKTKVKDLYQAHCSTKSFPKEDLDYLTEADLEALKELLQTEALHVQEDTPGNGGLKVSGLTVGVNKVAQMLLTTIPLRRELRTKEEEHTNAFVTWCILGLDGKWESLPKAANCDLEKGDVTKGIVDKQGAQWSVDLRRMEARSEGRTRNLKRLENRADFTLPLDWDNMAAEENLKVVPLQADSTEYRTVHDSFRQTATNTVTKIERLQNVHLRRTYEMQKQNISEKNKGQGAGEKWLYHGTSQETCDSIMKNGFNRSFSGKNGTSYGQGTYFAVNANYSVSYTRPTADGSRTMFLARVLTGSYTQGHSSMKCPPPRSSQESHNLHDTVVDRMDNPSMYVVFNDNQAYPDYLITFH